jgi:hypothetical protein
MANITFRMPDNEVHKVDLYADYLQLTRSEYIKKAILAMNKMLADEKETRRLIAASYVVRKDSMATNAKFEGVEYGEEV